jgi:hypothetical protein
VLKCFVADELRRVGETCFPTLGHRPYLDEFSTFLKSRSPYPTGESLEDLVWKIPIGDYTMPAGEKEVDFGAAYHALSNNCPQTSGWFGSCRRQVMQATLPKANPQQHRREDLKQPQEPYLKAMQEPYLKAMQDFAQRFVAGARACTTRCGYVGVVPGRAAKADMVVVLHGSLVPFLVRKSAKRRGEYTFLGECYIHGIMHGAPSINGLCMREIRLR